MSDPKPITLSRESVIEIVTSNSEEGKTKKSTVYSGDVVILDGRECFLGTRESGAGPEIIVLPAGTCPDPDKKKNKVVPNVRFVSLSFPASPDRFLTKITFRSNPLKITS